MFSIWITTGFIFATLCFSAGVGYLIYNTKGGAPKVDRKDIFINTPI